MDVSPFAGCKATYYHAYGSLPNQNQEREVKVITTYGSLAFVVNLDSNKPHCIPLDKLTFIMEERRKCAG